MATRHLVSHLIIYLERIFFSSLLLITILVVDFYWLFIWLRRGQLKSFSRKFRFLATWYLFIFLATFQHGTWRRRSAKRHFNTIRFGFFCGCFLKERLLTFTEFGGTAIMKEHSKLLIHYKLFNWSELLHF